LKSKSSQKRFWVTLKFKGNVERIVQVRASDLKTAERRALKRNPAATGVKRDAV
jgi:hypothetical protein